MRHTIGFPSHRAIMKFQSTHRVSDATYSERDPVRVQSISIHAPRERCDSAGHISIRCICRFQSTHRVSDATNLYMALYQLYEISIHAPRERCDREYLNVKLPAEISIHAPRERCDVPQSVNHRDFPRFQSTHRVSDATYSPTKYG